MTTIYKRYGKFDYRSKEAGPLDPKFLQIPFEKEYDHPLIAHLGYDLMNEHFINDDFDHGFTSVTVKVGINPLLTSGFVSYMFGLGDGLSYGYYNTVENGVQKFKDAWLTVGKRSSYRNFEHFVNGIHSYKKDMESKAKALKDPETIDAMLREAELGAIYSGRIIERFQLDCGIISGKG